ncbi:uncharacterized protein LOC118102672 isoform X7 [Hippoglossus stenolepis]|uniref:uncharacterized protein LOC118102672 isoform X7 n=1 Tax=Hippoglossus stenolepis TaxID=195615 RepID=UPI001FAF2E1B|nr:uncharacterized protein LOC118102672 isoform X7 [Hippoglossus stenolepis]
MKIEFAPMNVPLRRRLGGSTVDVLLPGSRCSGGGGAFGNFCTESTGFSRLFPGLTSHLLMLPFWFRVPLFREYIMSGEPAAEHHGICSSSVSCQRSFPVQPRPDAVQEVHPHRSGKTDLGRPDSLSQQRGHRESSSSLSDVSQRPVRAKQTHLRLQRRPAPHIQMTFT